MTNNAANGSNDLEINSAKFFNIRIPVNDVVTWLNLIRKASSGSGGAGDLDTDLRICKMYKLDEATAQAVYMVSQLVALEASGKIRPPINLYSTYKELADLNGKDAEVEA